MKSRKTFPKIFRKLSQVTLIHQMLLRCLPFRFDICERLNLRSDLVIFVLKRTDASDEIFITLEDPVLSIMATLKKWVFLLFSAFFIPLSLFLFF